MVHYHYDLSCLVRPVPCIEYVNHLNFIVEINRSLNFFGVHCRSNTSQL